MPTYDHVQGESFVTIWSHEDVPSVAEIIETDGTLEFDCPDSGDQCGRENPFQIRIDEEDLPEDIDHMVEDLEGQNGTIRCDDCDEPLFALYREGDHTGGFEKNPYETGVLYQ